MNCMNCIKVIGVNQTMRFVEQFGTGQGMGFHGFSDRRLVVTWLVLFPADMIWSNRGCFTNDHSQWFPLVKLNKGLFFFSGFPGEPSASLRIYKLLCQASSLKGLCKSLF